MASQRSRPWKSYQAPTLRIADVRSMIERFEIKEDTSVIPYTANTEDIFHEKVKINPIATALLGLFRKCVPRFSLGNFCFLLLVFAFLAPAMITYFFVYPFCRLVFGTLYPAYASYKAVRTKNLKEYVKWMMYWIVFALFTCAETFTDVFLSWFPFYYEVKIVLVVWLLSPATRGSSILYRKFVHPALCRREQEIDEYIAKAKDQGYHTVLNLGTKGVNYATTVIMQTAIKGGGGLVQQLRKSYSLSDLTEDSQHNRADLDEIDDVLSEARVVKRVNVGRRTYNRSASESNSRSAIYFSEVDVELPCRRASNDVQDFSHIKSSEDISSGYSSADNSIALREGSLTRAGSIGARTRQGAKQAATSMGSRAGLTNVKRPAAAEDYDLTQEYGGNNPHLITAHPIYRVSNTNPPFLLECIGNKVNVIQINNDNIEFFDTKNDKTDDEVYLESTDNKDVAKIAVNQTVNLSQLVLFREDIEKAVEHVETSSHIDNTNSFSKEQTNNGDVETNNVDKESMADVASISEEINRDSDDEASFGTPEDSPKMKKKLGRGKYGKNKAPSPPKDLTRLDTNFDEQDIDLGKIKTKYNTGDRGIARRKKRHKSHSPCSKKNNRNESTISKFIHLSGRFAFWNKNVSEKNFDNISSSSSEHISRSSSLANLEKKTDKNEPKCEMIHQNLPDITITNQENDNVDVGNEIINKSNALQQLINEKIESHPEYRRISLHEDEDVISSKSTDV